MHILRDPSKILLTANPYDIHKINTRKNQNPFEHSWHLKELTPQDFVSLLLGQKTLIQMTCVPENIQEKINSHT